MPEQDIKFFTQIPAWVDNLEDISDFQARLLGYIYTFENITGTAFPSNGKIAERFHKKPQSVQNAISDLYRKGYLKSEVTYKENSKEVERRYLYTIEPPYFKNEGVVLEKVVPPYFKNDDPGTLKSIDNILINKSINRDNNSNSDDKTKAYSAIVKILEENGFGTVGGIIAQDINKELDDFAKENNDNYQEAYKILFAAIKTAIDSGAKNMRFVWSITLSWYEKKLFTLDDVNAAEKKFRDQKSKRKPFNSGYKQNVRVEPEMPTSNVVEQNTNVDDVKAALEELKSLGIKTNSKN